MAVRLYAMNCGWQTEGIAANYYQPHDYDLRHDVLLVDGEHDLFGDGSVVCGPTYGHTSSRERQAPAASARRRSSSPSEAIAPSSSTPRRASCRAASPERPRRRASAASDARAAHPPRG